MSPKFGVVYCIWRNRRASASIAGRSTHHESNSKGKNLKSKPTRPILRYSRYITKQARKPQLLLPLLPKPEILIRAKHPTASRASVSRSSPHQRHLQPSHLCKPREHDWTLATSSLLSPPTSLRFCASCSTAIHG
jgi:hypothetical protein